MDEPKNDSTSDKDLCMELLAELKKDLRTMMWGMIIFAVMIACTIAYWGNAIQKRQVDHSIKIEDVEKSLLDNKQSIMGLERRLMWQRGHSIPTMSGVREQEIRIQANVSEANGTTATPNK